MMHMCTNNSCTTFYLNNYYLLRAVEITVGMQFMKILYSGKTFEGENSCGTVNRMEYFVEC